MDLYSHSVLQDENDILWHSKVRHIGPWCYFKPSIRMPSLQRVHFCPDQNIRCVSKSSVIGQRQVQAIHLAKQGVVIVNTTHWAHTPPKAVSGKRRALTHYSRRRRRDKRRAINSLTDDTLYRKAFHVLKSNTEATSFIWTSPFPSSIRLCRPSTVLPKYQCFPHLF